MIVFFIILTAILISIFETGFLVALAYFMGKFLGSNPSLPLLTHIDGSVEFKVFVVAITMKFLFIPMLSFLNIRLLASARKQLLIRLASLLRLKHFRDRYDASIINRMCAIDIHEYTVGYLGAIASLLSEFLIIVLLVAMIISIDTISIKVLLIVGLGLVSCYAVIFLIFRENDYPTSERLKNYLMYLLRKNFLNMSPQHFETKTFNLVLEKIDLNIEAFVGRMSSLVFPKILLESVFLCVLLGYIFYSTMGSLEQSKGLELMIVGGYRILPSFMRIVQSIQNIRVNAQYKKTCTELNREASANLEITKLPRLLDSNLIVNLDSYKINGLTSIDFKSPGVYIITGKSGVGKSSFLKSVFEELRCVKNYSTCYMDQEVFVLPLGLESNVDTSKVSDHVRNRLVETFELQTVVNKLESNFDVEKLSGGEKQRLHLLRCFASECEIILMDEPTAALDDKNTQMFVEELRAQSALRNIVVISHDERVLKENFKHIEILESSDVEL